MDVHFQPVVDMRSRRIVGAEALVRRFDARERTIPNGVWLPQVGRTGRLGDVDRWVMRRTVTAARRISRIRSGFHVSINADPDTLNEEYAQRLLDGLGDDTPPQALTVEVTERSVPTDPDVAAAALAVLHDRGVGVMLDDFGTGHSTFDRLVDLPITGLKIDQRFVAELGGHSNGNGSAAAGRNGSGAWSVEVARTVAEMSGKLGLLCVAEGVETVEQERALTGMGVRYAQGFLYAAAVPFETLLRMLTVRRRRVV